MVCERLGSEVKELLAGVAPTPEGIGPQSPTSFMKWHRIFAIKSPYGHAEASAPCSLTQDRKRRKFVALANQSRHSNR
jgi:hypothetical protein